MSGFFYPKLKSFYKNIAYTYQLPQDLVAIFDLGANTDQLINFFFKTFQNSTIYASKSFCHLF
jgi:hypothetical protein